MPTSQPVDESDIPLSCFECSRARDQLTQEVKAAVVLAQNHDPDILDELLSDLMGNCEGHWCLENGQLLCTADVHQWAQSYLLGRT